MHKVTLWKNDPALFPSMTMSLQRCHSLFCSVSAAHLSWHLWHTIMPDHDSCTRTPVMIWVNTHGLRHMDTCRITSVNLWLQSSSSRKSAWDLRRDSWRDDWSRISHSYQTMAWRHHTGLTITMETGIQPIIVWLNLINEIWCSPFYTISGM